MTNLHEITNRALEQWIAVTGVDPEGGWTWGSYRIHQINSYIQEAQDLDPSGLTAFMVVRAVVRDYIEGHKFDALSLLDGDETLLERISALRRLKKLTEDPEALTVVVEFQERLLEAADHYGVREKVSATIEDMSMLSHIRRDALICTSMLEQHTFAKGARASEKLRYNQTVIKLWNMNSMIRMAEEMPENGISIVMIRDPQFVAYSFFCFLLKDGENITIWTDRSPQCHPMAKAMSRGRGQARQFHTRAARLRFPYQLLDIQMDENEKHIWDAPSTALVRTNTQAVPLSTISQLDPDQILWAILALDVLVKKDHAEKLSVTGEAMTLQLAPGTSRVLPEHAQSTKALGHSEVSGGEIDKQLQDDRGFRSTGVNAWMEERYKDKIDPRLYNLTEVPGLQIAKRESWEPKVTATQEMVLLGGERLDAYTLLPAARGLRRKGTHSGQPYTHGPTLIGLDPVTFGSPKEMEEDRLWIARWNQAQALGMAAQAEFDARVDEVQKWFEERVRLNADTIIASLVQGSWKVPTQVTRRGKDGFSVLKSTTDSLIRWCRQEDKGGVPYDLGDKWPSEKDAQVFLFNRPERGAHSRQNPVRCFATDMAANCWFKLMPSTPEGIAALAGVSIEELPELLRFWNPNPPGDGNCILDRTDPLDSQVGNPWNALTFQVVVGLSKREWKRRIKACANPGEITWQVKRGNYWE